MVENKRISESSVPENGTRSFENDKIDDTFVNVVDEDYLSWLPAPVRAYSFGYCLLALNHRSGIIDVYKRQGYYKVVFLPYRSS